MRADLFVLGNDCKHGLQSTLKWTHSKNTDYNENKSAFGSHILLFYW